MAYNYEFPYTDPNLYNDDWLLKSMKELLRKLKELDDWMVTHQAEYEELKNFVDALESGDFPESFTNALNQWLAKNALSIVGELIKMIFFGLDDNGYLVAYIPEGWDDIIFNTTGYDIVIAAMPEYGHLVLSY